MVPQRIGARVWRDRRKQGVAREGGVALRRILDAVARLAVRVPLEPILPALSLESSGHRRFFECIAMLEVNVAFVDRLKARPARHGDEGEKKG
jgi:hypothetical protein